MAHALALIVIVWLLLSVGGLFIGGLFDEDPHDTSNGWMGFVKPIGLLFALTLLAKLFGF